MELIKIVFKNGTKAHFPVKNVKCKDKDGVLTMKWENEEGVNELLYVNTNEILYVTRLNPEYKLDHVAEQKE